MLQAQVLARCSIKAMARAVTTHHDTLRAYERELIGLVKAVRR